MVKWLFIDQREITRKKHQIDLYPQISGYGKAVNGWSNQKNFFWIINPAVVIPNHLASNTVKRTIYSYKSYYFKSKKHAANCTLLAAIHHKLLWKRKIFITFSTYEWTMLSMSWTILSGWPSTNIKDLYLQSNKWKERGMTFRMGMEIYLQQPLLNQANLLVLSWQLPKHKPELSDNRKHDYKDYRTPENETM